ncbi:NlpC/P60 family protein [Rhodococcus sp. OK302]|uniref:NlpC/P60 family protein n=1 Tax=Rhodococcus sp. OK302 TaxID=1882769 RepID=UPI000B93BBE9|nr:NlpC/P60 family protein [Rhodococcus sp. OK302]OYD68462.1 NlpC/P60 family protein [Rhodococcus sp. OK302]
MRKSTLRKGTVAALLTGSVLLLSAVPALAEPGSSGSSGSLGSMGSISSGSAVLPIPSPAGLVALAAATTQTGKPYQWGGNGPNSWDCSGLTQWAFRQAGVWIPRTSQEQANAGQAVPLWALAIGDIITFYPGATHVGIYAGGGMVFNAYGTGVPTGLTPLADLPINNIRRF